MKILKETLLRRKTLLTVIGVFIVMLTAITLIWFGRANSNQAMNAMVAKVYFDGEYRITDGSWQPIVPGQHIPATKGDVTLRGNFHMLTPDDEYIGLYTGDLPIAFYINHINLTFYISDNEIHIMDMEHSLFGDSACGIAWTAYAFTSQTDAPIEILIHNPHRFGNDQAIDQMLSSVALWSGIDFEN